VTRRAAAAATLAALGGLGAGLYVSLAAPTPDVPPRESFTLHDVTIVNPGSEPIAHRDVAVADGRIRSISDSAASAATQGPLRDHAGHFLAPGLIDMHVHHPPALLPGETELVDTLFLRHGVTAVRDVGSIDGSIFRTRQRVDTGRAPGPRIFACGEILDGVEMLPPAWLVEEPEEGRRAVAELAGQGADCIKVLNYLDPTSLAAIRDEASRHGLPVIGHVPLDLSLEQAQLDDVQHLTGVVPFEPGRGEGPFLTLTRGWGSLPASRPPAVVSASKEQGIAHTPTLVAMEHMARLVSYETERQQSSAQWLPRYYRDVVWDPRRFPGVRDFPEDELDTFRVRVEHMQSLVRDLHAAGVRIHAGTDCLNPFVVPGASLHEELELLVGAGLTLDEAWGAATRVAGQSLGVPGLGIIREGAPADFALYRRDPTRDLRALDSLEAVVTQGRLYERADLDRILERLRDHHRGSLYDALSTALARRLFPAG
jgi:imidazolonepropionase-like amidohydrolase